MFINKVIGLTLYKENSCALHEVKNICLKCRIFVELSYPAMGVETPTHDQHTLWCGMVFFICGEYRLIYGTWFSNGFHDFKPK